MFRRFFVATGALAVVAGAMLLAPSMAFAQRGGHGGGHHGGGHSAAAARPAGAGGNANWNHSGNYNNNHHHNNNFWWGAYPYLWYGAGLYGGYGGYRGYGYGDYGYGYDYADYSAYGPDYGAAAPAYTPVPNSVQVTVRVPDPNAQVWFGDTVTGVRGPVRQFASPPLIPGKEYQYEITASWNQNGQPVTQTRQVRVQAGSNVTVDFSRPQ